MADVNISKFRASVVREGSRPATPGFVVSEGQSPTDPAGSGQNHLPVTIAPAATALAITESQILSGAGTVAQYIRGDGSLADFPEASGGGSSISYYLNGSVNQGTIGGVAYKELSKVPILGAGTDFSISADGYIASFITDAGDPNLLEIPGGNWNFETYFSSSSSGGTPTFYVELYKYDGTTFTLIASNSGSPEFIAFGTTLTAYFSTLAVPTTTLALTDRLAVRYYVTHSGRTITLHTEDNHLCQIVTTFTTGLTALNGLTAQVQNFATGTTGTDFAIASATATHTFNLPTASATNRGALSSGDWTTFNNKENAITAGTTAQYFRGDKTFQTLNTSVVPELTNLYYTEARVNANANVAANTAARHNAVTLGTANGLSLSTQVLSLGLASAGVTGALSGTDWSTFNAKQNALGYTPVPETRTITINGTTQDLSANRTFNVGTVTSVGLSSATSGVTIGSTPVTGSGTITLAIATASGSQNGLLSSTDWTTFNSKQNALTNPVTGTGTTNYLPKFTGTSTIGNSIVQEGGAGIFINGVDNFIPTNGGWFFNGSGNYASGIFASSSSNNLTLRSPQKILFQIGFSTEAMTLSSSGNLLVGTTTDNGARLQVSGAGNTAVNVSGNGYSIFQSSAFSYTPNNIGLSLGYNRSGGNGESSIVWGAPASGFNFEIASVTSNVITPRMTITTSGNVLIGTTTDSGYKLDVFGDARFGDGNNFNPLIQFAGSGRVQTSPGYSFVGDLDTGMFNPNTGNTLAFATGGSERMRITSSGNVGIGTASPNVPLEIQADSGGTAIRIKARAAANSGTLRFFDNASSTQLAKVESSDNSFEIGSLNNVFAAFLTNATERMRITSGGNVLIGTTTDNGAKLNVNGTIRTANPTGSTSDGWLLGRALVSGTSTPDRWIRVQIGNLYYDILAVYMGSV